MKISGIPHPFYTQTVLLLNSNAVHNINCNIKCVRDNEQARDQPEISGRPNKTERSKI